MNPNVGVDIKHLQDDIIDQIRSIRKKMDVPLIGRYWAKRSVDELEQTINQLGNKYTEQVKFLRLFQTIPEDNIIQIDLLNTQILQDHRASLSELRRSLGLEIEPDLSALC